MPRYEDIEIRSEEVQEILGTPPNWLVRYGTTIALFTIVVLGWVSFFVEYPDTVKADIKVSSTDPPKRIVSQKGGYISLVMVENEDTVQMGETLIVFQNKANFNDVLTLEGYLINMEKYKLSDSALLAFNPPTNLLLGELQDDLYDFYKKQEALTLVQSRKLEKFSIRQLRKQIRQAEEAVDYQKRHRSKLEESLLITRERYTREQNLQKENLISKERVRQTKEEVLSLERMIQGVESSIKGRQFEMEMIRNEINGVKQGTTISESTASRDLKDSYTNLGNKVRDWIKDYLVTSPINGIVLLNREMVGEKQYVPNSSELVKLVPLKQKEIKGRIALDLSGSGKVQEKQKVVVKFKSYPFPEFGAVIGEVSWKGKVPNDNKVPIEVVFPDGLRTTAGKVIEAGQEMVGEAEIIMEEKRFIERIFENFRGYFS